MIKRIVISIFAIVAFVNPHNAANAINIIQLCRQDSIAQAADSIATIKAVAADSTAVVQAADSVNHTPEVAEEKPAVMDTLEILNPYSLQIKGKRKHFITVPLPANEYNTHYKFYKEHLEQGELFIAYDSWRKVFCSSEERSITLFNDGVPIIMGKFANDTALQVYDNIKKYREEVEELYEIAIENIDKLNEQIDYSRGGKPITTVELRSQQLFHYDNMLIIDSIFSHNHHNNYNSKEDRKYWTKAIFKDSAEVYRHYAWLKEMIFSEEKMKTELLVDFSVILNAKMNNDVKRLNLKENIELARFIAGQMQPEKERCIEKMNELYDDANYGPHSKDMHANLAAAEELVVDDPVKLEAMYRKAIAEGGYTWEILTKILNSAQLKNAGSPLYLEALEQKYQKEPTYALALALSDSYLKLANKMKSNNDKKEKANKALIYYQKIFDFPEFEAKSNYDKARSYVQLAKLLISPNLNKRADAYNSCKKAISMAPEYPLTYYIISDIVKSVKLKKNDEQKNANLIEYIKLMVIYDFCETTLAKIKELKNLGGDLKSDISEDDIRDIMVSYRSHFLTKSELHMKAWKDEDKKTIVENSKCMLPLPFGTFNTKIRIKNE